MAGVGAFVRAVGLQALGGLVVWIVVAVVAWNVADARLDIVTVLLLFAQLVAVPLGLLVLGSGDSRGSRDPGAALWRGGRFVFRIGAAAAIVSVAIPEGDLAAAVAALYLLPAGMIGLSSLLWAARGGAWPSPNLARVAASLFLLVGALLFVFHRQGFTFGGLDELEIQLAAVHFHFIGFALVTMAGQAARRHPPLGGVAVVLLVLGTVLTPLGLIADGPLRTVGSAAVLTGTLALVLATLAVLPALSGSASRLLFISSALAVFVGGMAAMNAIGEASGRPAFPLEFMARMHGTIAAVGVVGIGMLGWRLTQDR